jgi:hypothetical protein
MATRPGETTPNPPAHDLAGSVPAAPRRSGSAPIRILLSEGSSLSARQTITALGQCGYILDVCDPNPLCISRFSRFIRRSYRCPAVGTDPRGYLAFVLQHLTRERYDVLLPVHEQAFLFAKVRDQLPAASVCRPTRWRRLFPMPWSQEALTLAMLFLTSCPTAGRWSMCRCLIPQSMRPI